MQCVKIITKRLPGQFLNCAYKLLRILCMMCTKSMYVGLVMWCLSLYPSVCIVVYGDIHIW
jgi:hypothetical protein